ncbi:MAG: hypothetical protein KJ015_38265, partial [Myxococcales bacterium]|nr:hypothetical protein [Myxococcales bacterium]
MSDWSLVAELLGKHGPRVTTVERKTMALRQRSIRGYLTPTSDHRESDGYCCVLRAACCVLRAACCVL